MLVELACEGRCKDWIKVRNRVIVMTRLLCRRNERPSRGAAENGDELASSHAFPVPQDEHRTGLNWLSKSS